MENDYSGLLTDTPTTRIDYYPDIMLQKNVFCKHLTLPPYTQFRLEAVTKMSDLICTKLDDFLWTACPVRAANGIHKMVANKSVAISFNKFCTIEMKLIKKWLLAMLQGVQLFI